MSLIKINSQSIFSWNLVHFLILMLRFEWSAKNDTCLFNNNFEVIENKKIR